MRTVQTYILRLLVDPENPGVLRGALQAMPDDAAHPFVGEPALLTLLHRLARANERCDSEQEPSARTT